MSIRLSIKKPTWAGIADLAGTYVSSLYLLTSGERVILYRRSEDVEATTYSARDALSLIKAIETDMGAEQVDATILAWDIMGKDTFLIDYVFETEVVFPSGEVSYLFIRTISGEVTEHLCIACNPESCW